jgi:hypothetical protein
VVVVVGEEAQAPMGQHRRSAWMRELGHPARGQTAASRHAVNHLWIPGHAGGVPLFHIRLQRVKESDERFAPSHSSGVATDSAARSWARLTSP